jgi:hypothetical protein
VSDKASFAGPRWVSLGSGMGPPSGSTESEKHRLRSFVSCQCDRPPTGASRRATHRSAAGAPFDASVPSRSNRSLQPLWYQRRVFMLS